MTFPLVQVRHVTQFRYGDSLAAEARQPGSVPVYGSNGQVGQHDAANTGAPALVVGRKGSHGKLNYSDSPVFGIDTTYVVDAACTDADLRWLYYALSTVGLDELTNDVGVPGLSRDTAYRERIPVPEMATQRRIADFLDAETARIDALIDAKQEMIAVATERLRTALDAAVESATAAPVVPLRRFVTSLAQGTSSQAGTSPAGPDEWGILKLSAVKWGRFVPGENKVVPEDHPIDESLRPEPGDLLVTRSNTPNYVGDVCAILEPAPQVLLPDLIYRLRLNDLVDVQFASMALRTTQSRHALSSAGRGTSQSMVKLRGEDIGSVEIQVPNIEEQKNVVAGFAETRARSRETVDTLSKQIELLRERRSALITAAVAGELDL